MSYTAPVRVNLTLSGETSKSSQGMIILNVTILAKSHIHVAKLHLCNMNMSDFCSANHLFA